MAYFCTKMGTNTSTADSTDIPIDKDSKSIISDDAEVCLRVLF